MPLSMYQASVPVLIRTLTNLMHVLEKGAAYAKARQIDEKVLTNYRLAADMFPLKRQVMIATDMAKGCASRLASRDIPAYPDTEETFPELIARIKRCIGYLKEFTPAQIDGTEDKTVVLKRPTGDETWQGQPYLLDYVLPNVFFHVTTAYAILRHAGVDIGKKDFIG